MANFAPSLLKAIFTHGDTVRFIAFDFIFRPVSARATDRVPGGGVTGWSKTAREARST